MPLSTQEHNGLLNVTLPLPVLYLYLYLYCTITLPVLFLISWFLDFLFCLERFSEEGTPVSVDSAGVVRLLSRSLGTAWSPVCITKSNVNVTVVVLSLLVNAR